MDFRKEFNAHLHLKTNGAGHTLQHTGKPGSSKRISYEDQGNPGVGLF